MSEATTGQFPSDSFGVSQDLSPGGSGGSLWPIQSSGSSN